MIIWVISVVGIVFSVVLHEIMHGLVARYFGDTTAEAEGRLTLNPLAHIDLLTTILLPLLLLSLNMAPFGAAKPVPVNTYRLRNRDIAMALVGLAGPLTNLVIAFAAARVWQAFAGSDIGTGFYNLALMNVGLGVFNLMPFPPLDGSRLLYAIAPQWLQSIMDSVERAGFMSIAIFMFFIYPTLQPITAFVSEHLTGIIIR